MKPSRLKRSPDSSNHSALTIDKLSFRFKEVSLPTSWKDDKIYSTSKTVFSFFFLKKVAKSQRVLSSNHQRNTQNHCPTHFVFILNNLWDYYYFHPLIFLALYYPHCKWYSTLFYMHLNNMPLYLLFVLYIYCQQLG